MKYIDVEAAKKVIRDYGHGAIEDGMQSLDCVDDIVPLAHAMDFIPSADVAPVVHAEWQPLWFDDEDRMLGEPPSDYMCSNCKIISADNSDYCPHCGALMDGGESDD